MFQKESFKNLTQAEGHSDWCLGRKAFVVISSRFADIFSDFRRFYQFYKHLHKFNTSCFCSGPLSLRMDAETHRPAAGWIWDIFSITGGTGPNHCLVTLG